MDSDFFPGYRKTGVKPTEILMSVCIPYTQEVRRREEVVGVWV